MIFSHKIPTINMPSLLTINKSAGDYYLDYFPNMFHQMYQKISVVQINRVLDVHEIKFF